MSDVVAMPAPGVNYITARKGLRSWLMTTDHKRIGILYLVSVFTFFLFAMGLGFTMRLQLLFPGFQLVSNEVYNRILTLHGVTMIFLFIIPGMPGIFGNFFLPLMLGARDVAFPRLNLASWYLYAVGGLLALASVATGGPDTGWTFYVPYGWKTGANVTFPLFAAYVLGWSSILTGINFIVTTHRLRHPKMRWMKMPLFVWSMYATSWVQVIATPVIGILLLLVLVERFLGVGIFDPTKGGDPLLYEHVFWIYSHPAVYVMILPAMGVASEIIPTFSRKTIFGYAFIAMSSLAIAAIGSLVWGHHLFVSGMSYESRVVFSVLTFLVAVPSAVKVFNWVGTLYGGSIRLDPPMLLAMGFIVLFSVGGLTGLILGSLSANVHLHDTAFVVGHFHFTMFGGAGSIVFATCHYWFPKMFGRLYNTKVAHVGAVLFMTGFFITFFSLMLAGAAGMPRRYADYLPEYTVYHQSSTVGSWIMVGGILTMAVNLVWSVFRGAPAGANPYGGQTLEWKTPSPPPTENFVGEPDLSTGPYDYPVKVAP